MVQEYYQDLKGKYRFTDNPDATYIVLKNEGQIYRYDKKTLVALLAYRTPIQSQTIEIKKTQKNIIKRIKKSIKLIDVECFDDCVKIYFNENDLDKLIDVLGTKHGTYFGRANRYYKSMLNLPDYEYIEKELKKIKYKKDNKKLKTLVKTTAAKLNKGEPTIWTMLYNRLKKQLDLPNSIGGMARQEKVQHINIIDNQNWYEECFNILEEMK